MDMQAQQLGRPLLNAQMRKCMDMEKAIPNFRLFHDETIHNFMLTIGNPKKC